MTDSSTGIDKLKSHLTLNLPSPDHGCVWIHACSVGEVGSITPLIEKLLALGEPVHLTVVTRTGFDHARRLLGDRVGVSFLPWDLPGLMGRFVKQLRPRVLLLTETEFWPGMLKACRKQNINIIGINTRISDRSFPRYMATRKLWRSWLAPVSLFLAQSHLDAERLAAIGIPPEKIRAVGNLKYAIRAPEVDSETVRRRIDPGMQRPILLIASTHDDEEKRLLGMLPTWRMACPRLLPVIVPRHPERFETVARTIENAGLSPARWSQGETRPDAEAVLVDAMGVLAGLYTVADIVVIGGSLADIGGHNPLEAAVCGRGVVTGPHIQNFRAVMGDLQQCGGAIVARDDHDLQNAILRLLENPDELTHLHSAAAAFMHAQEDVLEHMWAHIRQALNR